MGTSGAYGGSGSQSWEQAADGVAAMPAAGPATSAQVAQTVQQIATAIGKVFPAPETSPTYDFNPTGLLGRQTGADGTSVSSGRTRSSGGGLSSSSAARGAAALWAGHAASSGSQADLDTLGVGLRLEDMAALTASQRCTYILDKILGAPGSPDEEILRRASLEALKELTANPGQSMEASMTAFMAAFVYQSALVELTSHKAAQKLSPDQVLKHEKSLRQYIAKTVKFSGVTDGPKLSIKSFMNKVSAFRDKAINVLRKATS